MAVFVLMAITLGGCGYAGTPPLPSLSVLLEFCRAYGAGCVKRRQVRRKKKTAPGRCGSRFLRCGNDNFYWVGRISCENPMVLTERNDGVRGGRHAGPRVKLVSKV